jgi:hypothetical protein
MSDINSLRIQADKLGLKYHHRAGEDKLRTTIGAYLVDNPEKAGLLTEDGLLESVGPKQQEIDPDAKALSPAEYREFMGPVTRKTCNKLRRVSIMCMDPAKKEWAGEVISVGSAKLGTFKKYIPYDGEPYHIPQIIYDMLKERQCTVFYTVKQKDGRGGDIRKGKLIPAYNIVDLPPLTSDELEQLANKQALAKVGA